MSSITVYLLTFALVALSWVTAVAMLDSSEEEKCDRKADKCWKKLALPQDWRCEDDEPIKCRPQLLHMFGDQRLCKNYKTFHDCVADYKQKRKACTERITVLTEYDTFLNVPCVKEKPEMSAAAICMSKDSSKKCITGYSESAEDEKAICNATNQFSKCLEDSFKKENCSMKGKIAVVSAIQDALRVRFSNCKLDRNGAATWLAASSWTLLICSISLLILNLL